VGVVVFPVFYGVQVWAVHHWIGQPWLTALYALWLPLSGFFVLHYWDLAQRLARVWQSLRLFQKKPSLMNSLQQERRAIFQALENAKEEYLRSAKH
ncbi:MAG: hypothetical protein MUE30_19070, partial [Spirosomaceae bacterium]|nr:hypothetical protein [Spirosomataceae bacterium]